MPTVFYETPRSRKRRRDANGAGLTRSWYCQGVSDSASVEALAFENNPLVFEGLFRLSVVCDPICADTWAVEVEYGIGSASGFTPDNYSFKITAQTVHITQSLQTVHRRKPGDPLAQGTAPDLKGAIGVTDDEVKGCDIFVPSMQWSKSVQRATVTHEYLRTLRKLVGTTNDAEFYGYQTGTLLYLGCEPSTTQATLPDGSPVTVWNLTHTFMEEPDIVLETIGNILIPRKKGHDYLWFSYGKTVPAGTNRMIQPPEAAYVERVYEPANYEEIEIGTGDAGS